MKQAAAFKTFQHKVIEMAVQAEVLKPEASFNAAPCACCHGGAYQAAPCACCHGGAYQAVPDACCHGGAYQAAPAACCHGGE
jgi:hypothetical protein